MTTRRTAVDAVRQLSVLNAPGVFRVSIANLSFLTFQPSAPSVKLRRCCQEAARNLSNVRSGSRLQLCSSRGLGELRRLKIRVARFSAAPRATHIRACPSRPFFTRARGARGGSECSIYARLTIELLGPTPHVDSPTYRHAEACYFVFI